MPTKRSVKTAEKLFTIQMFLAYNTADKNEWNAHASYSEAVDGYNDCFGGMPDEVIVVEVVINADGLTPEQRLRRVKVEI